MICPRPLSAQVFNPPYVPTPDDEGAAGGIAAAWAGGDRGRRVIDRVLPLVPHLLSTEGQMFMVTVAENDPQGGRRPRLPAQLAACREGVQRTWCLTTLGAPFSAAGIITQMAAMGFAGSVALTRRADEEQLSILHFHRLPAAAGMQPT